jgi:hypothetical protein
MAVTISPPPPPPAPDGQVTASAGSTVSPVLARMKWMEFGTRLLLFASIAIFAWTTLTALLRPAARRMIEPISLPSRLDDDELSEKPIDFFRADDDEIASEPRPRRPSRTRPNVSDDDDSDDSRSDGGKVELVAAVTRADAKLYGEPSEKSVEMGAVRAGETVFVMKHSAGWVLVLRGEGSTMGWMHRDNISAR